MKRATIILFVRWLVLSAAIVFGLIWPQGRGGSGPSFRPASIIGVMALCAETLVLGTGLTAPIAER